MLRWIEWYCTSVPVLSLAVSAMESLIREQLSLRICATLI